jgi:hypothetical protein
MMPTAKKFFPLADPLTSSQHGDLKMRNRVLNIVPVLLALLLLSSSAFARKLIMIQRILASQHRNRKIILLTEAGKSHRRPACRR